MMASACAAQEATGPLGSPGPQRALIRAQPGSFYSVDALNPDVVVWHDEYLMYFSGNSAASQLSPRWRTGLAIAKRPMGPFHVTRFTGDYLNGGTAEWRGRLWHLVEDQQAGVDELAVSTDGRDWRRVAVLPAFQLRSRRVVGADFSLSVEHSELFIYMYLVHTNPVGSAQTLGRVIFDGRRFYGFKPVLSARPPYDVGEPFVFRVGNRWQMLYASTAPDDVRSIALASLGSDGRWSKHGVLIPPGAPWAKRTAIDPSALRQGADTYVYYGGGASPGLVGDIAGGIGVAEYIRSDR